MALADSQAASEDGRKSLWFYSYLPTNMAGGCFDSLLPIFIVLALGGSVGDVALVSVAASLASVPSLIFWGKASDFMKWRKHFVVLGFLGRSIAYTMMGFAVGTTSLLFANIVMGLLAAASTPAMSILILESFAKEHWSEKIGLFNNIAGIGNLAGIALGSVWIAFAPSIFGIEFALRLLFLFNAVLAIVGMWLAFILIIEPDEKISRETFYEHLLQMVRWAHERGRYLPQKLFYVFSWTHLKEITEVHSKGETRIMWFLSATFIYNIGAVGFFTITPVFLLNTIGLQGTFLFVLSFIQALASTLLFKYFGRMSDIGDKPKMLFTAKCARFAIFGLYALAVPLNALSPALAIAFLMALHLALGATWSIIADTQLPIAVDCGPGDKKGSHAGIFNATVGLGSIAGGAVGGILALAIGFIPSILLCSAMVLVSAIVMRGWVSGKRAPKPFELPTTSA